MQISDLLQNKLVVNSLAAWAAAQIIKTVIYAIAHKELDWLVMVVCPADIPPP